MTSKKLDWMVNAPGLIDEMVKGNPSGSILVIPANILKALLAEVAGRAIEIDDPKLNSLMLRLALYECPPCDRARKSEEQLSRIA